MEGINIMSIDAIARDWGPQVSIVRIIASNTLAEVGTAGYILAQKANIEALNAGPFEWVESDMALVYASDGWGFFTIDADFESLTAFVIITGVTTPVVVGDFAVFDSTGGNIGDSGFLPSDATKTRVVMAGSATQIGYIAHFVDTTGTVDDTAGNVINAGNISAGLSGTAGTLSSFSSTPGRGALVIAAVANTGNTNTTISNVAMGQASIISIPDPAAATARFLVGASATPLVSGNFPAASGTGGLVVDSGFGADNILRYASVAISAAEFNGMYAAPKLLVAAAGANTLIVVDRMELVMTFVSAAYAAGGDVALQYDSTANGAGVQATNVEEANDFQAVASTTFVFNGVAGNNVGALPFTTTVNKGLYLSNITGAFTTGDGTWVAKIHYRIIATA